MCFSANSAPSHCIVAGFHVKVSNLTLHAAVVHTLTSSEAHCWRGGKSSAPPQRYCSAVCSANSTLGLPKHPRHSVCRAFFLTRRFYSVVAEQLKYTIKKKTKTHKKTLRENLTFFDIVDNIEKKKSKTRITIIQSK